MATNHAGDIIFISILYGIVGFVTAAGVYNRGGRNHRAFSELLAVGSIWPLFFVISLVTGYVKLLLRLMSVPRLTKTAIKSAQDEARGVSITKPEWR